MSDMIMLCHSHKVIFKSVIQTYWKAVTADMRNACCFPQPGPNLFPAGEFLQGECFYSVYFILLR